MRKLSSGIKSASDELKEQFEEIMDVLPRGWITIYIDKFGVGFKPTDILKLRNWLYKVKNTKSKEYLAPSPSMLVNIKTLIAENNWTAEQS